jgi:ribosomal protein S18 acetylase RimI-like enzyme
LFKLISSFVAFRRERRSLVSRREDEASPMTSHESRYTTKELSKVTWRDFESLFMQGNGWDHCWCMAFQRERSRFSRTRAETSVRNHERKRQLVQAGSAHGILVYAAGEPVGWCQYGPSEELTSVDRRGASERVVKGGTGDKLWRITCFVTGKRHRRRGVAGIVLRAALDAIRKKGGGLVEGYPVAHWHIDHEVAG